MTRVNLIRQTLAATVMAVAVAAQAAPAPEAPIGPASPAATAPAGPVVAYNEAVRIVNGKRVVQLPPRNPYGTKLVVNKPGALFGGHAGYMIETATGLVQCTVHYYDQVGCEPSDYGAKRKIRTWIVLHGGEWQGCIGVDSPKKCRAVYPKRSDKDGRLGGAMPSEES